MTPAILAPIVKKIIDEILERIPDPTARAEAAERLVQLQLEINKQEAAHPRIWVAGWRPYIGWVGGTALAYQALIRPISIGFGLPMPEVDMGDILAVLGGLLGFGGLRTFEKTKGISSK